MSAHGDRVCVIGAGSSGIASCQVLHARGIPFDCFEKGSGVGGNWRYENDNGMSSAYSSLFINTSRNLMEYARYPMPREYPDYPHHTQIAAYFDDYVDHFGFRDRIRFNTEVARVERADGGWDVTLDSGETHRYAAVFVANGHHWDPRWPEPPFQGEFAGEEMHSHHYKTPAGMEGKNVLVLGIGNSAMDIACETSRVSNMTYLAARRGAWIIPKYVGSTPTDELGNEFIARLPFAVLRAMYHRRILKQQGKPQDYGLPEPDHKLGEAHPTISSEILTCIGHGRVTPKPNIERLEGDQVRFVDGTVEEVDTIIYCTGYKITFPFFSGDVIDPADNVVPLYRRVVHPDRPGLFFIGLVQPLGAIMPLAEAQSEWIADVLEAKCELPSPEHMHEEIEREHERMRKRYVASKRHTIQVDFYPYLRTLRSERKRHGSGSRGATPTGRSRGAARADGRQVNAQAAKPAGRPVAVVTGAGRGFGREIARRLAGRGYAVLCTDIDGPSAERTAQEIGAGAWSLAHDVRDPGQHRAAAAAAVARGPLEVWVNNAGVLRTQKAWEHPDDEVRLQVEANLLGVMWGSRAAVEEMRSVNGGAPGHVINIASMSAFTPVPGLAVYGATKHGVLGFSGSLQGDLNDAGIPIRVHAVCPDSAGTDMVRERAADPDAAIIWSAPKMLTPQEVADKVVGLLDSRKVVLVIPRRRGALARAFGLFPNTGLKLAGPMKKLGERKRRRG